MSVTPEQFAASSKAAAEGLIGLANAQFALFERVVGLNVKATRSAYEDAIELARKALSATNPQDLASLNAAAAQPALERAQAYARELYEVVAQSQAQMTHMVQAQTSDLNKGFASLLDQYSQTAPGGSGVAMAAFKSMLAAATTACGSYNEVAKQSSEIAQAAFTARQGAKEKKAA